MNQDTDPAVFTWRDYEERGFAELRELLGEGWSVQERDGEPEVDVRYQGHRIGSLLAVDLLDVQLHLGPSECQHFDPDRPGQSCLSLTLRDDPFPADASPDTLAEAAAVFRRSAGTP